VAARGGALAGPSQAAPRSSDIRAAMAATAGVPRLRAETQAPAPLPDGRSTRLQARGPTAREASRGSAGTRPACGRARSTAFRTQNTPGSSDQPSGELSDDARSAVVGDHRTAGTCPGQHASRDVHRGIAVPSQILRHPL